MELRVTALRPVVYKIEAQPWGWYKLSDLAKILSTTPHQFWSRFSYITRPNSLIAVWPSTGKNLKYGEGTFSEEEAASAFVPAGWGNAALESMTVKIRCFDGWLYLSQGDLFLQSCPDITFGSRGSFALKLADLEDVAVIAKQYGLLVEPMGS